MSSSGHFSRTMSNSTVLDINSNSANFSDQITPESFSTKVPFIIILFSLIVATIFSNSVVVFAVYTFRGLRTVTNCFVVSLAAADLAVALLAMPVWLISGLVRLDEDGSEFVLELSTRWVEVFCCSASIYSATLVSLDRYLAIIKPLRYREMVTRRRANRSITAVWCMSIVVAAISYMQYDSLRGTYACAVFLFVAILCVPLCIMSFTYICIYRAAMDQLSKMKYAERNHTKATAAERRKRFYKELCITKTLAITVSLFVVSWAPFLIMTMVETFDPFAEVPIVLQGIIIFFPFVNSFANPWIYTGINKDFRKAIIKILCSPRSMCACRDKYETERSRAYSASRSLYGSYRGEDTATTIIRGGNSRSVNRPGEMQCTTV